MSPMRWKLALIALAAPLAVSSPAWAEPSASAKRQAGAAAINRVETFEVSEGKAGTMIRIKGSSVPTFSVFKLADPPRLFIDLSQSELGDGAGQITAIDNGVISQVALIGVEDSGQRLARVIVGFERAAHYDVRAEGHDVLVFIDGDQRTQSAPKSAEIAPSRDEIASELNAAADAALETERARHERELEASRARLAETQEELKALRQKAKRARGKRLVQLESQIEAKNDELALAKSEGASAREQLSRLESQIEAKNQELDRAQAERAAAIDRAAQAETQAVSADQAQARAQADLDAARARLERQAASLAEREREAASLATSLAEREQLAKELAQKLERREAEAASLSEELKRRQAEALQSAEALKARQREAQDQARSLQTRAEELEGELKALSARVDASGTQSASDKEELARLQKASSRNDEALEQAKREQRLALKAREQSERTIAALQTERDERAAELERLKSARSAEQDDLKRAEGELKQARSRSTSLEDDLKRQQGALDATQREREELSRRLELAEAALKRDVEERASRPAGQALPIDLLAPNLVKDIRLETSEGRSRIVVELDRPGEFETVPGPSSRAVMILNNTELPADLERTLSSEAQGGAVRFVSSFIDDSGQVRMEAELGQEAAETVRAEGNTLVWEFAPTLLAASSSPSSASLPEERAPEAPEVGERFTSAPPLIVTDPTRVSSVPGMSRKRLTIDYRNADIQNVLRLFAQMGNINIIAGDEVSGVVTMKLRSVPLEEAFLTILQSQGLGFEKRGNVIRVTTQEVLLNEQGERAAARQALLDSQPLEVFLLPINYADAGALTGQVQGLLSGRGSVTVDERTNTLIIKDIADNLEPIRVLVENLDLQVPQVLIEARIVETNDTFQRQIGVQWGGDFGLGAANGNPTGLIFPSTVGVAGGATDGQTPSGGVQNGQPNYAVNLPAPIGTGSGGGIGLTMGSIGGNVNLNLRLTALEEAGHARIVSAPKILTLDNNEASISQGTSIPISVVGAAGVQTVFVQAVLELVVTPHVTPDGNIQLRIVASKNEPDFQNTGARGDPTIIRRNAETELLIKDGDTTVIGGIYTRNSGDSISAVPFLHKIPILGFFFRSRSESERRSELLIFITPRIVNRAESLGVVSAGTVQSSGSSSSGSSLGRAPGAAPDNNSQRVPALPDTNVNPF